MALTCVNGCKECDGCMECQANDSAMKCDVCGHEIYDIYYNMNDEVLCEECMKELYMKWI